MDVEAPSPEDAAFADALGALTHPVRLAILRQLRTPRALKDIRVTRDPAGAALARQTVKAHLERLVEAGLVASLEGHEVAGGRVAYVLNHQALFALSEDIRARARWRPATEPDAVTRSAPVAGEGQPSAKGPRLVLVSGLEEGRVFPLTPPAGREAAWVVGRRRDVDVPLDFDPFVSAENAVVRWHGNGFTVETVPGARNGARLNYRPLGEERARALAPGDLVGVGRSTLMFRE